MQRCKISSIIKSEIVQVTVQPEIIAYSFVFDEWEAVGGKLCQYNWTYKAYYEEIELHLSELKGLIEFNATNREFKITPHTDDQHFNITLVGVLSDLFTTDTIEFLLVIAKRDESKSFVRDKSKSFVRDESDSFVSLLKTQTLVTERFVNE